MTNLLNLKVKLRRLIISNLLLTTISFSVYANPSWTERLVYTSDNLTFVVGESVWTETKYDAFQSAFLDGLNKINVMRNTEIETSYIERVYNGKISAEEFSKIKASNNFGKIIVRDSFAEREHVSDLNRVFVLLEVTPEQPFFDFEILWKKIKSLFD